MRRMITRRSLLAAAAGVAAASHFTHVTDATATATADAGSAASSFPTQDPELVREMVTVAHGNVARVKELVGRQPTLAKAAWDWGFGDWETALGAASHVGNREIADILLANGARPTILSAAMLGQLDVVKAFVTASPGVQRIKGPHSITLLRHAMAGGAPAKAVVEYLTSVGGADERITEAPLTDDQRAMLVGAYAVDALGGDRIDILPSKGGSGSGSGGGLQFARSGRVPRGLLHVGSLAFCPVGAENVRIRFAESAGGVTLTVHDPDVVLTAIKRGSASTGG
jgi:hypothetical protein